jgi:hypothetical protein
MHGWLLPEFSASIIGYFGFSVKKYSPPRPSVSRNLIETDISPQEREVHEVKN